MVRMMWQLWRTAKAVKALTALKMFREVRIRMGAHGIESALIVKHHGVVSEMSVTSALGLAEAQRKIEAHGIY